MTDLKRKEIKEAYVNYLTQVPSHKFASMSVGVDRNTTLRWRDEDKDFATACELAIATFVSKTTKKTRPEFQLERLLREDFGQSVDLTSGNKPLPTPIVSIPDVQVYLGDKKDSSVN